MIAIIDYGIGNLRSIEKAFAGLGVDVIRTDRAHEIIAADKVVLPGVGAFGACAAEIRMRSGLEDAIHQVVDANKPFLGVCVGMQLLFDVGEEMGLHEGLGVIPGRVVRFDAVPAAASAHASPSARAVEPANASWPNGLKIPHMGWNTIRPTRASPLLKNIENDSFFYFVHSFVCVPNADEDVLAECRYGVDFAAVIERNNVFGVQFHPEKSQQRGLQVLKNFADIA